VGVWLQPFSANLVSARASTPATGTIQIKLGFVEAPNTQSTMDFQEIYTELVRRSRPSLVSAPPVRLYSHPNSPAHSLTNSLTPYQTEGVGAIRSHQHGPEYEDDGGISSDEEPEAEASDDEDEEPIPIPNPNLNVHLNVPALPTALSQMYDPPTAIQSPAPALAAAPISSIVQPAPVPFRPAITIVSTPASPTSTSTTPTTAIQSGLRSKPGSPGLSGIFKILRRPTPSKSLSYDSETSPSPTPTPASGGTHQHERSSSGGGGVTPPVEKRKKFRRSWSSQSQTQTQSGQQQQQSQGRNRKKRGDYNFSTENDIQGIVMLEILGATDLPKIKNSAFPHNLSPTILQS
jgi:phosphatidylserine decarboxylase